MTLSSGDLRRNAQQGQGCAESGRPVLLGAGGIKPPLLFGEPIDQPVEEQPYPGTQSNGYSVQREIVDRAVLSLKDAGVPSFLIE
jgi:hypothetical protein